MIWMIFGSKRKTEQVMQDLNSHSVEESVLLAQENELVRHHLIKQYQPFIAKTASKVCKKYIDPSLDEYSVALQGFNEAIDKFNPEQGDSFLSFAEIVIQRRVIDYIRKEMRQTRHIYLEDGVDEQQEINSSQLQAALNHYYLEEEKARRRAEIMEYQQKLQEFEITFQELAKLCPKHSDARENAKQVAKVIAENPEFVTHILEKKQLPMKELLDHVNCSRKTIERHRKYIIAMVLIYAGGYHSLRAYIEPEREGGDGRE